MTDINSNFNLAHVLNEFQNMFLFLGFASTLFNTFNPALGNDVTISSDTQTYKCELHPDGCTTTQITCNTE